MNAPTLRYDGVAISMQNTMTYRFHQMSARASYLESFDKPVLEKRGLDRFQRITKQLHQASARYIFEVPNMRPHGLSWSHNRYLLPAILLALCQHGRSRRCMTWAIYCSYPMSRLVSFLTQREHVQLCGVSFTNIGPGMASIDCVAN